MIKKAIATALADGTIDRKELYGLDDEEFFARFTKDRHPAFQLVAAVRMRRLHKMVYQVPFRAEVASHAREAEPLPPLLCLVEPPAPVGEVEDRVETHSLERGLDVTRGARNGCPSTALQGGAPHAGNET